MDANYAKYAKKGKYANMATAAPAVIELAIRPRSDTTMPDDQRDEAPDSSEEIYALLRDQILDGALRGRLPTREVLADRHGVSVWTIGRVITRLRNDGLVVTRGGNGTWVARRDES